MDGFHDQRCPLEHEFVTRQLNMLKADENLWLVSRPIDEDSNALARYIAGYGLKTLTGSMILFSVPLGRIRKPWSNDMGLGPVREQFVPDF